MTNDQCKIKKCKMQKHNDPGYDAESIMPGLPPVANDQ